MKFKGWVVVLGKKIISPRYDTKTAAEAWQSLYLKYYPKAITYVQQDVKGK